MNVLMNVKDNTVLQDAEMRNVLLAIRTQEAKAEQTRQQWIKDAKDEALILGFSVGMANEKWINRAVGTVNFAAVMALEWNYTETAPELRVFRRAVNAACKALENGAVIDSELSRLMVRALSIAGDKIFAKAPIAAMNEALRVIDNFFKKQQQAALHHGHQ